LVTLGKKRMQKASLIRFAKYAGVGVSTFGIDLTLLSLLTEHCGVDPVPASGIGFLVGVSINYVFSRRLVFRGAERSVGAGYMGFLVIAGAGLAGVTGLMYLLVERLGWNYLLARVLVAAVVGTWNYLLNLYVNFKVAGRHE
jgi:putative flippase GtrA